MVVVLVVVMLMGGNTPRHSKRGVEDRFGVKMFITGLQTRREWVGRVRYGYLLGYLPKTHTQGAGLAGLSSLSLLALAAAAVITVVLVRVGSCSCCRCRHRPPRWHWRLQLPLLSLSSSTLVLAAATATAVAVVLVQREAVTWRGDSPSPPCYFTCWPR